MLAVHIFNIGGYIVFFEYQINRNNFHLIEQLDDHQYDESQLIELKIHLPLPYNVNRTDYQRIDGMVQYDGIVYNYVKRKVWNDTLYVLCLPNTGKMKLTKAKSEYAGRISDVPADHTGHTYAKKGDLTAPYLPFPSQSDLIAGYDAVPCIYYDFDSPIYISAIKSPDQPPENSLQTKFCNNGYLIISV